MLSFTEYLSEGINDPAIFKVIFLAGGPGSGKSFMVRKAALQALGFVVLNSDDAFEHMMKKAGLDMKMPESEKEQRDKAREAAKATTMRREDLAIEGRLGMVIDGTGRDYDKIMKMRGFFATKGYDSAMVFVNTDLDTALARNAKRARSVPDDLARKLWQDVQNNIGKYQTSFREHFFVIDNSEGADYESQTTAVFKKVGKWVKEPPRNGVAVKWIKQQRKQ